MADVKVTYKGSAIVELNESATKILKTSGKYCEGDIRIDYVKSEDTLKLTSWQQTQSNVQNYLNYVKANPYSDTDYSTSVVSNYIQSDSTGERPVGAPITLSNGTLTVGGVKKDVKGGTIYNSIPNTETPFVLVSNNSIIQAGALKPTIPLRQINCATRNVRDLGGWKCDGGTIKYGKLFRGGEVSSIDDVNLFVNELGIRAELDLQGTASESVRVLSDYVDYLAPNNGTESWDWYTLVNKTQMKEALSFVFDCVKKNKPVYFHCTVGADRTGTLACILESLLGVSSSDIDTDYELTSFYNTRSRTSEQWIGLQNEIKALAGDTRQYKIAKYISSLGFSDDEINEFRKNMIDGNPTILVIKPAYTNMLDLSSEDWLLNKRINSSNNIVDAEGWDISNFIPMTKNDTLRYMNMNPRGSYGSANYGRIVLCGSDKSIIATVNPNVSKELFETDENDVTTVDLSSYNFSYVRICCARSNYNDPIATVNEEMFIQDDNLFKKNSSDTMTPKYRINSAGVAVTASTVINNLVTNFIPCSKLSKINVSTDAGNYVDSHDSGYSFVAAFYNSDKTYLSKILYNAWDSFSDDFKTGTFSIPDGASYCRIAIGYSDIDKVIIKGESKIN